MERSDFAVLLRAWRDRLPPAAVGLPIAPGRRAAGLRREELALLAGISVDYLIRLEQNRSERPSLQVVQALARTLQLDALERDDLHRAAGLPVPLPTSVPTFVPPSVQRLLLRLGDAAIAVYSLDWTLLTANATWGALLGPVGPERNAAVQQFTGSAPAVIGDPRHEALFERALVSDLRRASIRYPADPDLRALVVRLRAVSSRFESLWSEGVVAEQQTGRKTFHHPLTGPITLDCDVLVVAGSDLYVVTYSADPRTEDLSRLELLRTVGASRLPAP